VLPGRHDLVRVDDPRGGEVLDPGVAVEAAPVCPELRDPRPDLLRRCGDRDRLGQRHIAPRHQPLTRERALFFVVAGSPAPQRLQHPVCRQLGHRLGGKERKRQYTDYIKAR